MPVETIRLEYVRDGLENFEYFAILKKLDPANPLLKVPPEVSASRTEFSRPRSHGTASNEACSRNSHILQTAEVMDLTPTLITDNLKSNLRIHLN